MERKKRSKGRGWESCYVKKIYGTFGVEMRAYGQKLVKFCTHTHTRLSYSSNDTLYADICTALLKASTGCIEKGRGSNNEHMVPGWNDSVTDLHAEACDAYVLWRTFGIG